MSHAPGLLVPVGSLTVDVLSGIVRDTDVSKTGFARSELANIIAGHCTGWRAVHALADSYGEAVSQSAVGTTYTFQASA